MHVPVSMFSCEYMYFCLQALSSALSIFRAVYDESHPLIITTHRLFHQLAHRLPIDDDDEQKLYNKGL